MSQFSVYCCEIDMVFQCLDCDIQGRRRKPKRKVCMCEFVGNIPSAVDVCPYNTYSIPKITSEHLIRMINNDQIKRKSFPVLKCSHLWGEMWQL